jgi:hypothetical protein
MWSLASIYFERHPLATGALGTSASAAATMVTFLQQLDAIVRVAGGVLGLAIAILTLAIQWRNFRNKR